jgi:hypothetical protein
MISAYRQQAEQQEVSESSKERNWTAEKTAQPSSIETELLPRAKSPNTTFGWIENAWKQNILQR